MAQASSRLSIKPLRLCFFLLLRLLLLLRVLISPPGLQARPLRGPQSGTVAEFKFRNPRIVRVVCL